MPPGSVYPLPGNNSVIELTIPSNNELARAHPFHLHGVCDSHHGSFLNVAYLITAYLRHHQVDGPNRTQLCQSPSSRRKSSFHTELSLILTSNKVVGVY